MTVTEYAIRIGEETGLKLEIAGGIPTWEAPPTFHHQSHRFRIQSSIRPAEGSEGICAHASDVLIRFPDGSIKRPDLAIFCREPEEQISAITMPPETVVEILSPDYEAKDLAIGVPFYLRSGIKDILVLAPETGLVRHFRPGHAEQQYARSGRRMNSRLVRTQCRPSPTQNTLTHAWDARSRCEREVRQAAHQQATSVRRYGDDAPKLAV
jgi:Uma2 family endonuclease